MYAIPRSPSFFFGGGVGPGEVIYEMGPLDCKTHTTSSTWILGKSKAMPHDCYQVDRTKIMESSSNMCTLTSKAREQEHKNCDLSFL